MLENEIEWETIGKRSATQLEVDPARERERDPLSFTNESKWILEGKNRTQSTRAKSPYLRRRKASGSAVSLCRTGPSSGGAAATAARRRRAGSTGCRSTDSKTAPVSGFDFDSSIKKSAK